MRFKKCDQNPNIPSTPPPPWAAELTIPANSNEGIIAPALFRIGTIKKMLFGQDRANELNRKLKAVRLRPIMLAMCLGTFVDNWIDPILIDWNWKIISGQKRLYAYYYSYVNGQLAKKYAEGIWLRLEYGLNPELRALSDSQEPRKLYDMKALLPNRAANKALHETLICIPKFHSHASSAMLSVNDTTAFFRTNPEGFEWICSMEGKSNLRTAPVRLGLAEGYKISQEKTVEFAQELFDLTPSNVKQARDYRRWFNLQDRRKDQQTPYRYIVDALVSYFGEVPASTSRGSLKTWNEEQMALLGYPEIKKPVMENEKEDNELNIQLEPLGIPNIQAVIGAVRLLYQKPDLHSSFIADHVTQNKAKWLAAQQMYTKCRRAIGPFSAAALVAFCFQHGNNRRLEGFLSSQSVVDRLQAASELICARFGGLRSRSSREACLHVLHSATNIQTAAPK